MFGMQPSVGSTVDVDLTRSDQVASGARPLGSGMRYCAGTATQGAKYYFDGAVSWQIGADSPVLAGDECGPGETGILNLALYFVSSLPSVPPSNRSHELALSAD